MGIWDKLTKWARRDKNVQPPPPSSREPSDNLFTGESVSMTKRYASGKMRNMVRAAHRWNRKARLKDPADAHRQKLKKLGL